MVPNFSRSLILEHGFLPIPASVQSSDVEQTPPEDSDDPTSVVEHMGSIAITDLPETSPANDAFFMGRLDNTMSFTQEINHATESELLKWDLLHNHCLRFLNLSSEEQQRLARVRCKQKVLGIAELLSRARNIKVQQGDFDITVLVPGVQSMQEVVASLLNNVMVILMVYDAKPVPGAQLSELQSGALHHFRSNQHLFFSDSVTDIDLWFKFYDDFFFGGILQARCTVAYNSELEKGVWGVMEAHHEEIVHPNFDHSKSEIPVARIEIRSEDLNLPPHERRLRADETLLHEMAHAFVEVYACGCGGYDIKACQSKLIKGACLHGVAWQACFMLPQEAIFKLRLINGTSPHFALDRDIAFLNSIHTMIDCREDRGIDCKVTGDAIRRWDDHLVNLVDSSRADVEAVELDRMHMAFEFESKRDYPTEFFSWLPDPRDRLSSANKWLRTDPILVKKESYIMDTSTASSESDGRTDE